MRGVYTASALISSLATSKTVVLLTAPATAAVEILGIGLSNTDSESSEQWDIALFRVTTLGSAAGTSVVPAKHENGDTAANASCLVNLTVEPTTYETVAIDRQGVSNLAGYRYDPIPEERPALPPSGSIGLKLISTPSSFNAAIQITFREIG